MKTLVETYKGYQIRKSGTKYPYFKVFWTDGHTERFRSIEAARVAIDSQGRVMTPEEHAIMHPEYQDWLNGKRYMLKGN